MRAGSAQRFSQTEGATGPSAGTSCSTRGSPKDGFPVSVDTAWRAGDPESAGAAKDSTSPHSTACLNETSAKAGLSAVPTEAVGCLGGGRAGASPRPAPR